MANNVTVSETVYNVTVSETNQNITTAAASNVNVQVNTTTLSTGVNNTGSGAEVLKGITGDTLYARTLTANVEGDIVVTQNTDTIDLGLAPDIEVNTISVDGSSGDVLTVSNASATSRFNGTVVTGTLQAPDIDNASTIDGASNITITAGGDYIHADTGNLYVSTDLTNGVHITPTQIKHIDGGTEPLDFVGDLNGAVRFSAKNKQTGSNPTIKKGQAVYISGLTGNTPEVKLAQANSSSTMPAFGIAFADANENANIEIVTFGTEKGLDVADWGEGSLTFAVGDVLYVSASEAGKLTNVTPATETNLIQNIGKVQRISPSTNTSIKVGGAGRTNATPNLNEGNIFIGDSTGHSSTASLTTEMGTRLSSYSGHIIPSANVTYDLGSTTKAWRDVYVGPGSLYVDGQKIVSSDEGTIDITTDSGQNLNIQSGGDLTISNTNNTTSINDTTVNLGPAVGSATVNVRGTLESPDTHVGDLELEAQLINQTTTNGNLEIRTNGQGYLHANVADMYVGPLTGAVKIDENSISVTAGTLTVTGNLTGDVTGTVSDISNHSTTDLSEGTNKYYTDERVDDRVNALLQAGSNITLTYDDNANTLTISSTDTEDDLSNNTTDDLAEGSTNLYYTDARFNTAFGNKSTTDLSEGTNLYYTDSRFDTRLATKDTDDLSEGSSNQYFTNARAISAVEGEATLDLTGALTVDGQISTDDVIKVNDGFVLTSFNPYGAGSDMPVTIMGSGQQEGWAAMTIRSRGEHDFGLGAPYNLAPRGLLNLQAGRLDGSDNDDYLNNNDSFGAVLWSPYAGFRTGTEWLTPAASIYGIATEDHSASGMGTKLEFSTTENGNTAGAADLAHTNKSVFLQGTTFSSTDTIKIDDDLQVTGDIGNNGSAVDFEDPVKVTGNVSTKTATIGDFESSSAQAYANMGVQIDAGDTAWPTVTFKEYAGTDGGGNKPVNLFTNPGFETEVFGGTPSSPAALGDAKRILSVNGNAADSSTLPNLANIRLLGQTVGVQSGTNRGSEFILQTTPSNETTIRETLKLQGNIVQIGDPGYNSGHGILQANGGDLKLNDRLDTDGNNIINSSGDVTVDDNLKVNTNLTVDGNTTLGNDATADTVTVNGKITANGGLVLTSLTTAEANYFAGLGAIDEGAISYISDGDSGSKCIAIYDGSNWKRISLGSNISSS